MHRRSYLLPGMAPRNRRSKRTHAGAVLSTSGVTAGAGRSPNTLFFGNAKQRAATGHTTPTTAAAAAVAVAQQQWCISSSPTALVFVTSHGAFSFCVRAGYTRQEKDPSSWPHHPASVQIHAQFCSTNHISSNPSRPTHIYYKSKKRQL